MHGFNILIEERPSNQLPDCDLFPEIARNCGICDSNRESSDCDSGNLNCDRSSGDPGRDCPKPAIRFTKTEWDDMVIKEGKFALIGRFVNGRPSLDLIWAEVRKILGLEGSVQIGALDRRSVLLRFNLEADCRKAWLRGRASIGGCRLWFAKWSPDWSSHKDAPIALVWFQLPNLPIHLFDFDALSRICNPIGRVIALDSATERRSRPSVAKVRLEIDVRNPDIERIWIEFVDGGGCVTGFWQRIERDRVPAYCICCSRFGHLLSECRRKKGEGEEDGELIHGNTLVESDDGKGEHAVMPTLAAGDHVERGTPPVCGKASMREEGLPASMQGLQLKDHATGAAGEVLSEKVKPASVHVTEDGGVVIEEKEGNDGGKVAGVMNNRQQEKGNFSIPCISKQQKAINAKEPEQCVTPKRKGIGDLNTEKIIAQFSKEMTAIIQESIRKKERKGKEGGTESSVSAQARVKDVSEGSEKGERRFKNTMEWVNVVEELMKKDKGFDQKVNEALKEVNTYLWTVYDKKKEEYVVEGRNRAMRAATIFLVKVKLCPSWNRENGMLGKYLKANIDAVGARICHWAVTLNL